jgi:hypothetical protein
VKLNQHIKSVFTNEQELLKALINIHLDGRDIEADPMYFKGNFYKNGVNRPKYISDLNPQYDFVKQDDAEFSMLGYGEVASVILDPPFLFGIHGKTKDYYSAKTHTIYKDFSHLEQSYFNLIKDACRYLVKNGVMIFKCQDYTDSKTTFTHCLVLEIAERWGFYAKDMAILVKPNKVSNPNTKQRHLRKIHTYFWVFVKKGDFEALNY